MLDYLFNDDASLSEAENYEQWRDAALRHDQKNGMERWKLEDESSLYDFRSIRSRLDRLRRLRANKDVHGLLFALNEGIHGNMSGMGGAALYGKSKFGTKQLIVDYVDEVSSALEYLASGRVRKVSTAEKTEFFHRASHCFGRSALLMSGAGSLLYFHLGVVKALWKQRLLPRVISGASGGSFVAALVGTHTDRQLKRIFEPSHLNVQMEEEEGVLRFFSRMYQRQVPADEVYEHIARLIPDLTFQEAFERTGRHINVPIAPAELHQGSRLLNATTSPNVLIREAVLASCAVPGVYPPVTLAAKDERGEKQPYLPSRQWIDGSVSEDLPIKRLSRLYGVNHTIVSQTNPLVLPFLKVDAQDDSIFDILRDTSVKTAKEWSLAATRVMRVPAKRSVFLSKALNTWSSVISQTYTGDINILPPSRANNPLRLLAYRRDEEIREMIMNGKRATWPKMEMIRLQTKIGRTLDRILDRYGGIVLESGAAIEDHSRPSRRAAGA
ncbi:MAG: DUF3336 domain-containing protein [Pseudomonadota bacterium]